MVRIEAQGGQAGMRASAPLTQKSGSSSPSNAADRRLHGRWLVAARISWLTIVVPALILLFIAVAILHSRLWDIDILINRALVYGTLSVSLVLLYAGCVIGLQFLLSGFTAGNDLAIVASTLAIAALFQPLRRLIQQGIDRRFYRRKYDAARIVAAYGATLRNEVDLSQLSEHLVAVVQETMQPAHISLWLRETNQEKQSNTKV
jgi:hypothetical protein